VEHGGAAGAVTPGDGQAKHVVALLAHARVGQQQSPVRLRMQGPEAVAEAADARQPVMAGQGLGQRQAPVEAVEAYRPGRVQQ
jgi:hypothetical protein